MAILSPSLLYPVCKSGRHLCRHAQEGFICDRIYDKRERLQRGSVTRVCECAWISAQQFHNRAVAALLACMHACAGMRACTGACVAHLEQQLDGWQQLWPKLHREERLHERHAWRQVRTQSHAASSRTCMRMHWSMRLSQPCSACHDGWVREPAGLHRGDSRMFHARTHVPRTHACTLCMHALHSWFPACSLRVTPMSICGVQHAVCIIIMHSR